MLLDERLRFIENYVNENGYASIHDIMEKLSLSKATARRDLIRLNEKGRIGLVRGGAISIANTFSNELPYDQKQGVCDAEKRRIAEAAVKLIRPNSTIILDSGTTTRKMTALLYNIANLHVITADLAIASDLTYYSNIKTTVIGGTLRPGYFNTMGYIAENTLKKMRADIAFCATDAINPTAGCMTTNVDEIGIKRQILASSSYKVMLCDHSKVDLSAAANACKLTEIDLYIMGQELDASILQTLKISGASVELA